MFIYLRVWIQELLLYIHVLVTEGTILVTLQRAMMQRPYGEN